MNKILIATLIYIPLIVILGVGVYEIPESWYRNLVCPLLTSVITTVWGSLSLNWYDRKNKEEGKERTFKFKKSKFVHDSMTQYVF